PSKSFIQPPVYVFINFLPYGRIFPVQIRLFFMENMHILLVWMPRERFPYRTAEIAPPIAGEVSLFPFFYIEKIAVFPAAVSAGFFQPFMFIGTVIYHKIHQNIHITFLSFSD